jgi:hypothetical protein
LPAEVEESAREQGCLDGTQYVYRDGEYGGRPPVASIGCRRTTRFRGPNYEGHKVALVDGWIALKSPSINAAISTAARSPATQNFDETLDALLRLTDPDAYSPQGDPWISDATDEIDNAIDTLAVEFANFPYLHRVEHSLHVRLCAILRKQAAYLSLQFQIGDNLGVTQLVHKEWPETFARPEKNGRRGNFDVVVLSPALLANLPYD